MIVLHPFVSFCYFRLRCFIVFSMGIILYVLYDQKLLPTTHLIFFYLPSCCTLLPPLDIQIITHIPIIITNHLLFYINTVYFILSVFVLLIYIYKSKQIKANQKQQNSPSTILCFALFSTTPPPSQREGTVLIPRGVGGGGPSPTPFCV